MAQKSSVVETITIPYTATREVIDQRGYSFELGRGENAAVVDGSQSRKEIDFIDLNRNAAIVRKQLELNGYLRDTGSNIEPHGLTLRIKTGHSVHRKDDKWSADLVVEPVLHTLTNPRVENNFMGIEDKVLPYFTIARSLDDVTPEKELKRLVNDVSTHYMFPFRETANSEISDKWDELVNDGLNSQALDSYRKFVEDYCRKQYNEAIELKDPVRKSAVSQLAKPLCEVNYVVKRIAFLQKSLEITSTREQRGNRILNPDEKVGFLKRLRKLF